jgi:hypothetical protein
VAARVIRRAGVLLLLPSLMIVGCGGFDPSPTARPTAGGQATSPSNAPTGDATRDALFEALGTLNLIVAETAIPYRPAEADALARAPRKVYQVTLPEEPDRGFIVVYRFDGSTQAAEAASHQRDYLGSGPGRVQTPLGTEHVIRQVGSSVVYYHWLPAAAVDPATPRIAEALQMLGTSYDVTS